MRALRIATLVLAVLSLIGGTPAMAIATTEPAPPIQQVNAVIDVYPLPGGTFDVDNRVFQYREYPVAGSLRRVDDPRLFGEFTSDWNWDVRASGDQPVPAWGTMKIDTADGTWEGAFTGIRPTDYEPVGVRALLFGDGAYEGLCATLDISALGLAQDATWVIDGVVHPDPMAR
jgi:hypothetical protein